MPSRADQKQPTATDLADLSALADGTLDPSRRAAVEARIAASRELSALYAGERQVVAALHRARESDRAPDALRARIEASRPKRSAATRRRLAYAGGLVGALAAIALALVLLLPSGTPGAPSVSDAAALAVRGPALAPPEPDPSNPAARLEQRIGDLYFPNWASSFGWRPVGARTDHLGGQRAVTVYYERGGQRIAYTIVDAPALPQPAAPRTWLHRTELRTFTLNGRLVVAWREAGKTCVLSATGISAAELQKLAAWSAAPEGH